MNADVTLNPDIASLAQDTVHALRVPGGFFDVLVQPDPAGRQWQAVLLPRAERGTTGARIELAAGADQHAVLRAAQQWRTSANTLAMTDRCRVVDTAARPARAAFTPLDLTTTVRSAATPPPPAPHRPPGAHR